MMENVSDVHVTQSARMKLNGQVTPIHQVQYMVGGHGPFTDTYEEEGFTPQNVQTNMQKKIVSLHEVGAELPHPLEPEPGSATGYKVTGKPIPTR